MSGSRSVEDSWYKLTLDWEAVSRLNIIATREKTSTAYAAFKAIYAYASLCDSVAAGAQVILRYENGEETELVGIGEPSKS